MQINGRLHDVQGWSGESEALPPGEGYHLRILEVVHENSTQKGTPMMNLSCEVLWPESLAGRKVTHRLVADMSKDVSRRRMKQIIDATGIQLDQQGGFDSDWLVNAEFEADCINEPYQKVDATSGQTVERTSARLQNEQPVGTAAQRTQAAGGGDAYPGQVAPQNAPAASAAPAARPTPGPRPGGPAPAPGGGGGYQAGPTRAPAPRPPAPRPTTPNGQR
jgi:hypothetical protein